MKYFLIIGLSLSMHLTIGQAWSRQKNSGYLQLGFSSLKGKGLYLPDGSTLLLPRVVKDQTIQLYGEYGITNKLTTIISAPFKFTATGEEQELNYLPGDGPLPSGNLNSLGNIEVGLNYGFKQSGAIKGSFGIRSYLPTASFNNSTGLRTGTNTLGVAPGVYFGFSNSNYFAEHKSEINIRNSGYSTQYNSSLSLGVLIENKLYMITSFDYLMSFYDGNYDDDTSLRTGLYVNNLEYMTYTLKFGYKMTDTLNLWLSSGGGIWGHLVIKAPALSIAISHQW